MTKAIKSIVVLTFTLSVMGIALADSTEQQTARMYEKIWDGHLKNTESARSIYKERQRLIAEDWEPSPVIVKELSNQARMNRITAASLSGLCDFQIDYALGPDRDPPHIRTLACCEVLLIADARILLRDNMIDNVIDRLVSSLAIAEQTLTDLSMQAADIRIETIGFVLQIVLDIPLDEWTPDRSQRMADSLAWINEHDPFGLRESIAHERDSTAKWLQRVHRDKKGKLQVLETTAKFSRRRGIIGEADSAGAAVAVHLYGGFETSINQYTKSMNLVLESLDDPDHKNLLKDLNVKFKNNEYGPFARAFTIDAAWFRGYEASLTENIRSSKAFFAQASKPSAFN